MKDIKRAELLLVCIALVLTAFIVIYIVINAATVKPVNVTYNSTTSQNADNNKTKVNINGATLTQLQKIKGIGPVLAQNIIDYRNRNGNFRNYRDVLKVKGIGEKKLEDIQNCICFE